MRWYGKSWGRMDKGKTQQRKYVKCLESMRKYEKVWRRYDKVWEGMRKSFLVQQRYRCQKNKLNFCINWFCFDNIDKCPKHASYKLFYSCHRNLLYKKIVIFFQSILFFVCKSQTICTKWNVFKNFVLQVCPKFGHL